MMSPFSDSIVFTVHTRKQRFQKASFSNRSILVWRAFSNGSVFGDRFRRCSVDDSRIRSKTAPFSFENGLVWTGSKFPQRPVHTRELAPETHSRNTLPGRYPDQNTQRTRRESLMMKQPDWGIGTSCYKYPTWRRTALD